MVQQQMDVITDSVTVIVGNIFQVSEAKNVLTTLTTLEQTQNAIANIYTRLLVTCLYLSPRNNANSLSTLIAATVHSNTNIEKPNHGVIIAKKT